MCLCGCMGGDINICRYTYKKPIIIITLKRHLGVQGEREIHLILLLMFFTVCLFNAHIHYIFKKKMFRFFKCFKVLGLLQCPKEIGNYFYKITISCLKEIVRTRRGAMRVENRLKGAKCGNRENNQKTIAIIQVREMVTWSVMLAMKGMKNDQHREK